MNDLYEVKRYLDVFSFNKNSHWFLAWGIIFIILGSLAISEAALATYISIVFLGVVILSSGVVIIIDSFTFWWKKWRGFFLHLLMGLLYLVSGLTLILNPYLASYTLTWLIGMLYVSLGLIRFLYSMFVKPPKWGWNTFNAITSFFLGILILFYWPNASLFFIGVLVGIELIIVGCVYVIGSLSSKKKEVIFSTTK